MSCRDMLDEIQLVKDYPICSRKGMLGRLIGLNVFRARLTYDYPRDFIKYQPVVRIEVPFYNVNKVANLIYTEMPSCVRVEVKSLGFWDTLFMRKIGLKYLVKE